MSRFGTNWQKFRSDSERGLRSFYPKWYWRLTPTEKRKAHEEADWLGSLYRDPIRGVIDTQEATDLQAEFYGWGVPQNRNNGYDARNWKTAWQLDQLGEYSLWHHKWEKKAGMHTKTVVI